jgi:hypothetical protein
MILSLLYSPPVQCLIPFVCSITFVVILASLEIALACIVILIYFLNSFGVVQWCIQTTHKVCRTIFPETIETIERKIAQTFVCKGDWSHDGLYVWHPHGLFASAPMMHTLGLGTNSPKTKIATLAGFFKIPVIKEFLQIHNFIPSNYSSLKEELEKGGRTSLVLGGVEEMFRVRSKEIQCILEKRTGYLRLALETKKPLIPVITYGENELFIAHDIAESALSRWLKETIGVPIPIPKWESLKKWMHLENIDLPLVQTHIGEPVEAKPDDTIESLREKYKSALQKLFDTTHPEGYTLKIL